MPLFLLFLFLWARFFSGKKKKECAPGFDLLLSVFTFHTMFLVRPNNFIIPSLFHYFKVQTIGELVLICGFALMAGACIIFAIVDERGPGWVPLNLYFLICLALAIFCLFYHTDELSKWIGDLLFFLACFFVYRVTLFFLLPGSEKETLPYFFGGLGLYYAQLYVLLSPGIQSWVLGLGGLTLLVDGAKKFLLGGARHGRNTTF